MTDKLKEVLAIAFEMNVHEINSDLIQDDVSNWDSLKQMELVVSLEREFNMTLEMMEIVSMTSIQAIINILIDKGIDCEG